jgi:hypothetical protein
MQIRELERYLPWVAGYFVISAWEGWDNKGQHAEIYELFFYFDQDIFSTARSNGHASQVHWW